MNRKISNCLVVLAVVLSGCGGKNHTSSGGADAASFSQAENTIQTETGGVIYTSYSDRGMAGEAITLHIKFREKGVVPGKSTGTLHWGDFTEDRVRDGISINHKYRSAGTYTVALQPDGGQKLVVATIVISESDSVVPAVTPPAPPPPPTFSAVIAVAGAPGSGGSGSFIIEAIPIDSDLYSINIVNPDQDSLRSGTLAVDGSPGTLVSNPGCSFGGRNFNASIVSVTGSEMVLRIDRAFRPDLNFTLPVGSAFGLTVSDCI